MATSYVCDFCGEPIEDARESAHLTAFGAGDFRTRDIHQSPCLKLLDDIVEAACDVPRPLTEAEARTARYAQLRDEGEERRAPWRTLSMPQREHLIVELLGDDRGTVSEIKDLVLEKLGRGAVDYGDVYSIVKRLHLAKELSRAPVASTKTKKHYRYFRRDMSGAIVDLERTFNATDEAA